MYLVRRVYTAKPGKARKAASLIATLGDLYHEAGTRSETTVYFNSGTTPGETNQVVMQWTDEALRTPYRDGRTSVEGVAEIASELRDLLVESTIEFWELMTDEKRV